MAVCEDGVEKVSLEDVLRRAKDREAAALTDLVRRYSPRVYGLLYRLTGRSDTAEELVQETFVRVVRTIGSYQDDGRFEAWLFRIAANLARDRGRQRKRRGPTLSLDDVGRDGQSAREAPAAIGHAAPDAALEQREAEARLTECLAELSDGEREVILLRHFSGLSFNEIAAILGVPLGTALARSHRALTRLRVAMGGEENP